jgi:hypothetical protein
MWFAGKMANFHLIAATWLDEVDAEAARMREALGNENLRKALYSHIDHLRTLFGMGSDMVRPYEQAWVSMNAALSSSAGREFLERCKEAVGLLRRVFDAASYPDCQQNPGELASVWAAIAAFLKRGESDG